MVRQQTEEYCIEESSLFCTGKTGASEADDCRAAIFDFSGNSAFIGLLRTPFSMLSLPHKNSERYALSMF